MSADENSSSAAERRVIGKVVSDKMDKTVTVAIERYERHPVYGKYIRRTSNLLAHDEENTCRAGDKVAVTECRPLSKRKAWRVIEVVERFVSPEEAQV